jgi:hypothetical protein
VPASASNDSTSPKIIPFFTTESDPDQLAVLQSLISEYQNLNPGIEVDMYAARLTRRGLTSLASADLGIFEIDQPMSQWADAEMFRLMTWLQIHAVIFVSDLRQNETITMPCCQCVWLWVRRFI